MFVALVSIGVYFSSKCFMKVFFFVCAFYSAGADPGKGGGVDWVASHPTLWVV